MKIRNGFVSNSSSSSFVVSFPRKPMNSADVWKFMFEGKDGGISAYDLPGLSLAQIASNVFASIKNDNFKQATLKDIVDLFAQRYNYYPSGHNTFWMGRIDDEDGGSWCEPIGKYCGSDSKTMGELKSRVIERERRDKELREKERDILDKSGLKAPKYAYEGGEDYETKKPYTKEQIKASNDYQKDLDEFKKANADYIAYEKERRAWWDGNKEEELRQKIATADAKVFLKDHKGTYIFIVSYCDNEGDEGCTMEHGDIFRNVPHVTVNQH